MLIVLQTCGSFPGGGKRAQFGSESTRRYFSDLRNEDSILTEDDVSAVQSPHVANPAPLNGIEDSFGWPTSFLETHW